MPLTDVQIRKAQPKEKSYRLSDAGNLYLEVTPAGGKLWRYSYSFDRKEKLMALGKYPEISLATARERHLQARQLRSQGVDPMAERQARKKAIKMAIENSFASVSKAWLQHWRSDKSPRHVDYTEQRLQTNILPSLGGRPIDQIEAPEIVTMVKEIEARGARDIAKRTYETTSQIFRYAIAHGHAKRNPASEVAPRDILTPSRKTNFARIDAKELPNLLRAIEGYPGTPVTRLAIKFMLLTFVRTGELIGARWDEIDLGRTRWDIPADRMKMRISHTVPLSTQAIEILKILHSITGDSGWVFPGDRDSKKHMSNNTILKGLDRIGYKGTMTGHGFRGLASTILHEEGFDHQHIELQLAHTPRNAVSAAYNHASHLHARSKMMQEWADLLDNVRRGGKLLCFEGWKTA